MPATPDVISVYFLPVLTAAAVGYLTNYAAIWLLFKPYHPVPWLKNLQGVIPGKQAALAETLGREIPENLLPPDALIQQVSGMLADYLQNPELISDIHRKVTFYVAREKNGISAKIIPYIENAAASVLENHFTLQNVKTLYDLQLEPMMMRQISGEELACLIAGELKAKVPEITVALRKLVRSGAQEYIKTEYPTLTGWLRADEFAARMVTRLNWQLIQNKISGVIGESSTRFAIRSELARFAIKLRAHIHSGSFDANAETCLQKGKAKIRETLHTYLEENLPDVIEKWMQKDDIWSTLENELLPAIKNFVIHRLKRDKEKIIAKLDLAGRIEESIMKQTPETIHAMVNRVSGEHLVLLQLLGYLLGGVAGGMLVFAQ